MVAPLRVPVSHCFPALPLVMSPILLNSPFQVFGGVFVFLVVPGLRTRYAFTVITIIVVVAAPVAVSYTSEETGQETVTREAK